MNPRIALVLAIAGLIPGRQTTHPFAAPDASWQLLSGQLKYTSGGKVLVGEVIVLKRGDREFQVEFQKGVGVALMRLHMDATTARAEGPLARGTWQGPPDQAPKPLRGWMELRATFVARKAPGRFTYTSRDSQQRFDFIFSR